MIAALVVVALLIALTGLGRPVVRVLGPGLSPSEQWLAAPLVGTLPMAALILAVGGQSYTPTTMAAVLAVTLAIALWAFARESWHLPTPPPGRIWRLWVGVALVLVAVAALSAYAPASDHDTIRYHLTLPRRDLELGRFTLWFGWSVYEFFPPLASLLTRLVYALGGVAAAQLLDVGWMVLAAMWAGLLAARLGGGPATMALAALLFMAQRVVVNLAPAVTVDIPLAALVTAATTIGLALAEGALAPRRGTVLLALLLGAMVNVKYHGGIAALAVLTPLGLLMLAARRSPAGLVMAGLGGLLLVVPLLLRNAAVTGNPVFPLLHPVFVAGGLDPFARYAAVMAERVVLPGGGFGLPWTMFVEQGRFDGLQFGFPLALVALPFAFTAQWRQRLACLATYGLYVLVWWLAMPHLLRFQLPMLGGLMALTALGLARVGEAARGVPALRPALALFTVVAMAVQGLFVGSSAIHRIPAALGSLSAEQALEAPAFVYYSLISPCRWLEARLRPGERYLALVNDPSVHCPQAAALHDLDPGEAATYYSARPLPAIDAAALAERLERGHVRYVLVGATNPASDDDPKAFAKHRHDAVLLPLLRGLPPAFTSPSGNVYDAAPAIAALRR